jgi:betaine lipid synthase
LGSIPFYVWIGCQKKPASSLNTPNFPHEIVHRLDAAATESPYLSPINHTNTLSRAVDNSTPPELRSKAFNAAIVNLSANLPLPSFFYQNHHWRIHYDDQLKKHTQFKNEYIYAFTWEDSRVDQRLLKLTSDDVVLAITSAGDNILSYALSSPARIHAVDLNPNQNHLLELKVASFTALPYSDFWKLFGVGKHPNFRDLLVSRLSPHLSSRAFQYWLSNADVFSSKRSKGLYETGGSRHAIRILRLLSHGLGFSSQIKALVESKTLNEQREIWTKKIRPIIMSRLLSYFIVSQEKFLWVALGVPHNQLAMLEADHISAETHTSPSPLEHTPKELNSTRGAAVWEYMVQTLDPVIESSLIGEDNPYYLVCLQGSYSQRCHPDYLKPKSHQKLSRENAFDGLRIHTDEINEVVSRLTPGTLTVAVVMDSMDWFDPGAEAAATQIEKLNRALKLGGRILLRSAALTPWYIATFESMGFQGKRVGARIAGGCIDRFVLSPPPIKSPKIMTKQGQHVRILLHSHKNRGSCPTHAESHTLQPRLLRRPRETRDLTTRASLVLSHSRSHSSNVFKLELTNPALGLASCPQCSLFPFLHNGLLRKLRIGPRQERNSGIWIRRLRGKTLILTLFFPITISAIFFLTLIHRLEVVMWRWTQKCGLG